MDGPFPSFARSMSSKFRSTVPSAPFDQLRANGGRGTPLLLRVWRANNERHYPRLNHEVGSIRKGAFQEFEQQGCCDYSATGKYLCAVLKSALPERTDAATSATSAATSGGTKQTARGRAYDTAGEVSCAPLSDHSPHHSSVSSDLR